MGNRDLVRRMEHERGRARLTRSVPAGTSDGARWAAPSAHRPDTL